jgi:hypothetical protein
VGNTPYKNPLHFRSDEIGVDYLNFHTKIISVGWKCDVEQVGPFVAQVPIFSTWGHIEVGNIIWLQYYG